MKAIDQYVTVVLYISLYKVVLGFESLGELRSVNIRIKLSYSALL